MKKREVFCDVLVVGAGLSGVAAAVSAARQGANTILLEKSESLGGTAIAAMHRYICGLRLQGIAKEIASGLSKLDPQSKMIPMGRVQVLPFQASNLKIVLSRLIKSEKRIKVFYNTEAILVKKNKGIIVALSARCGENIMSIHFKTIIDASAEGVVIKLSGAQYNLASLKERQLQGFSILLKGLESKGSLLTLKIPYSIRSGIDAGELPKYLKFVSFTSGSARDEGICKFNIPYIRGFNINKQAAAAHNYLRKRLPELRDSYIAGISSELLQREGIRLWGDYILTKEDVLAGRKFKDACAAGDWPVEFWHQKHGQQLEYLAPGKFYEIPVRCLHSINIKNLFACGRCISATPQALASTRVMGICIATGEAAGLAATNYAHTLS